MEKMTAIEFKPVGIVHSPFRESKGTPIQPSAAKGIEGTVEVFGEYAAGLKDLDGFSHIILICYLHMAREPSLEVIPYMDDKTRGVFSTRAPNRPNPVGISVVRLLGKEDGILRVQDLDIIDGTPLIDIKPYIPLFDARENIRTGWLENNLNKFPGKKDDGRFTK